MFEASYDAWGRQTVTLNTIGLEHGYCGHDMLPFDTLIDMGGRVYDSAVGRFLSCDNYVQEPNNSQNFNRYSYCLNNPLRYTDPTGDFFLFTAINAVKDLFVNTFVKVWTQGFNAWSNGDNWHSTYMAYQIEMGMFKGDFTQIVSRMTWEAPQTILGTIIGNIQNTFYGVKSVSYYGGATVIEHYSGDWGAFTLGNYINGNRGIEADPRNSLFQHEYGHYLQSQSLGYLYIGVIAIPSLIDASIHRKETHNSYPTEQDANIRAFAYFSKHVTNFLDSNGKNTKNSWNIRKNNIIGYDWSQSINSVTNKTILKSILSLLPI